MVKQCRKCGSTKPLELFYAHPRMADGRLNICCECIKSNVKARRQKNSEYVRAYDRQRAKVPERQAKMREIGKRNRDLVKRNANRLVSIAIKTGAIARKPCEKCGCEKSEAHHEDYEKPLDVVFLCSSCHKKRHVEINAMIYCRKSSD